MEIEFFGAAGEVTGSCHILRVNGQTLLVDCGLVQGGRDATRRNRFDFPFDPAHIDAVLLTHAHIDHCGRLPLLVKRGFRGPIYTNAACRDLLPLLLRDTADLAARESERRARRADDHEPIVEPLFDLEDVKRTLKLVRALRYDTEYAPFPGVSLRIRDAGHILGSSSLDVACTENGVTKHVVFSGDVGQYDSPILLDPFRFDLADVILMESTYGDRLHHRREDTIKEIGEIIREADQDNGNVVVPAFAVGRSQEILYLLGQHFREWGLARWKISSTALWPSKQAKSIGRMRIDSMTKRGEFERLLSRCRSFPIYVCVKPRSSHVRSIRFGLGHSSLRAAACAMVGASCITPLKTWSVRNVTS